MNEEIESVVVTETAPKPKKRKAKKAPKTLKAPGKAKKRKARAASGNNGHNKALPVTRHTVPDSKRLSVAPEWRKANPKSPMSPSAKRFELYKSVKTVGEYRALMKKAKTPHFANLDLARDRARGYISFEYNKS